MKQKSDQLKLERLKQMRFELVAKITEQRVTLEAAENFLGQLDSQIQGYREVLGEVETAVVRD